MNSFIETLNQWSEHFPGFAWPMLWQSSLLIAALFAFDILFRRKLRASIRYALWLVVLVKLCIPPTFALPTSPAWWLHQPPPPIAAKPKLPLYTVTYDQGPLAETPSMPLVDVAPPKPEMTKAAWLLAISISTCTVLLVWMLVRWWQITRLVRRAATSERLTALADEVRRSIGMKNSVPVKLTAKTMSPAVCGLFRPVILIPQMLAENFSDEQLRAVLLHELIHLRRCDVWLNFLQTLVQIAYWWHPLVWVANARIRRVREEAVDDAVMLALHDEAETYAPTLLEVAKLALNRPLATLGLVGILESRSALRQRIERLVDFRPPRKAGLTLVSLLGILAFTAVAVPMGEAPAPVAKSNETDTAGTEEQSLTVKVDPEIFFRNLKAHAGKTMESPTNYWGEILMELLRDEGVDCNPPHGLAFTNTTGDLTTQNTPEQLEVFRRVVEQLNRADGICKLPLGDNPLRKSVLIEGRIYPMSDGKFDKFTSGLHRYSGGSAGDEWWSVPPELFKQFVSSLEASGLKLIQRPRIQTGSGITATFYVGDRTNSLELTCKPLAGKGSIDLSIKSTFISGAPANAFTNHVFSKASAEDHGGIVLCMTNYGGHAGSNLVAVISAEIVTNMARFQDRLVAVIKRGPADTARQAENLVQDGKLLYEMGKLDEAEINLLQALKLEPGNDTAKYYLNAVRQAKISRDAAQPNTNPQMRTNRVEKEWILPRNSSNPYATNPLIYSGPGRQAIVEKLARIRFASVSYNGLPLNEVLKQLSEQTKLRDPERKGVNFLINSNPDRSGQTNLTVDSLITIDPPLTNAPLGDVLDAVVKGASEPIYYSIQDFAIVFSAGKPAQPLFTRVFNVDTNSFLNALRKETGMQTTNVSVMARSHFSKLGVDLESPKGKAVFYNYGLGRLFVKATEADLDIIERAISTLNQVPLQIHIKARFIEVPKGTLVGLNNVISTTNQPISSNQVAALVGILTDKNFRTVLRKLETLPGVETSGEPEVVTTSGRQTQMRATTKVDIVYDHVDTNIVPLPLEIGPVLDVVPYVLSDGYTINLTAIPSLTKLFRYTTTPTNAPEHVNNVGDHLPVILTDVRIQQAVANVNLWDGQTVVLGKFKSHSLGKAMVGIKPQVQDMVGNPFLVTMPNVQEKELLVFITMTIVNPAGNRVHPDDSNGGIPPQPPQSK